MEGYYIGALAERGVPARQITPYDHDDRVETPFSHEYCGHSLVYPSPIRNKCPRADEAHRIDIVTLCRNYHHQPTLAGNSSMRPYIGNSLVFASYKALATSWSTTSSAMAAIVFFGICGASLAEAQVIYQDNFQSATNGQSIFAAPVNYVTGGVQGGGEFTLDNTTPFGPALAVDRPNPDNYGVARYPISAVTPTAGMHIIMTAQIYAPVVSSNDAWVGLNKSSIGPFNNTGVYAGCGNTGTTAIVAVDLRGIGGVEHDFTGTESAPFLGKIVTATIDMNVDTNTVTATFSNGVDALTFTQSGGLNFSGFDNVAINETSHNTASLMYVGALQAAQVVIPALPGDIDNNGQVNLTDYGILKAHWLQIVPVGTDGDLNLDGKVNLADFKLFKTDYNGGGGLNVTAPVPEPSSLVLAGAALPMLYCAFLRHRKERLAR